MARGFYYFQKLNVPTKMSLDYQKNIILAKILNLEVVEIIGFDITNLNQFQKNEYADKVKQLESGIPLDYVLGEVVVGDLKLELNNKTLIPREETEYWIKELKQKFVNSKTKSLVDLGCGCGLIGLSLANLFHKVILIDLEPECIRITQKNAKSNEITNVEVLQSNGLKSLNPEIRDWILVSNPPYLPTDDKNLAIQNKVNYEPALALYSGLDGLDLFRKIILYIKEFQNPPTSMYFELDPRNINIARDFLQKNLCNYESVTKKDLNGLKRFLECEIILE